MNRAPRWNDGAARSKRFEFLIVGRVALLLTFALVLTSLVGCGKKEEASTPPASETTPAAGTEAGGTQTINLNWDQQDSCVTFVPKTTSIHVGDQVNFNTSMSSAVTVTVPGGLFSAGDTTITVVRGPNVTSPVARALGSYSLTSVPRACQSPSEAGGPSIIVDAGGTTSQP